MNLDDRLLKAIAKLGWVSPTLIQEKGIPLFLEGKDVLAKGRTGSGKTAVFAIPIIQNILTEKQTAKEQVTRALILAPTKELCQQLHKAFQSFTTSCSRDVSIVNVGSQTAISGQKTLLAAHPDIIIATPSTILVHLVSKKLVLKDSLQFFVIDEADLVFSFGFEEDLKSVLGYLPTDYQCVLTSATLGDDIQSLKQLVLHQPVTLKLEEPELPPASQLTQYQIYAEESDKAVLIYALFKLGLVRGKTIIFVRNVDRCYKLKLYLQQFGIPSCALNGELPVNSRCHIVQQFNAGIYDIIIASDESTLEDPNYASADQSNKGKRKNDKESGVVRGIDFQFVSNVINFDFPSDVDSYIHRVGRTARGNNKGTALSFVSVREKYLMERVEEHLQDWVPPGQDSVFKPYQFRMEEIEAFRYRSQDAWKTVTRIAVREARLAEIKSEMMQSKKLRSHFENNPNDMGILRHDKALHTVRIQSHLKDVPDYIIPPTLRRLAKASGHKARGGQSSHGEGRTGKNEKSFLKRKDNPLLTFEFDGFKKKARK
ncbi:hypothetical protein DAPPUDRAFT_109408 [Daphnia pulex]|uniref:RNA helicase n=1 Tax=Daphnia pulex TaxID=6669 RepID=E9H2Z1_DAPPU|nr:hypothetical protein DAPPUDRAFT_109408 [Daphnia pulex]|eukprot:EFX73929.1 hypothetical protein DAPPUDRAFT_109408 [Daphnia pulex]